MNKLLLALLVFILLSSTCKESTLPNLKSVSTDFTGRDYLVEKEIPGYTLYSYLLFSSRPNNEVEEERYKATLSAFLVEIVDISELEEEGVQKDHLKIIYLPIKTELDYSFTFMDNSDKIDFLYANYDYAKAKVILRNVNKKLKEGPYIVSCEGPLLDGSPNDRKLVQNLTNIHPKMANRWMEYFIEASSNTDDWDNTSIEYYKIGLRDNIKKASEGLEDVIASVSSWSDYIGSRFWEE